MRPVWAPYVPVVALALPATLQATRTNSLKDSLFISRISSVFLLIGGV
jgi:hypothetical protein